MPSFMSALEARPLRWEATCARCGATLPPKTLAAWNKELRQAICQRCLAAEADSPSAEPELDRGTPGASAAREGLRRERRRDARTITAHPRIGKYILALSEEPQSTRSWKRGAAGERALGAALEKLRDEGFGVLHDRQVPGTRTNIDHIVVGPAGIFVIDAKRYTGLVERRDQGWILDRDWRLYVNGRDQTKLVHGMPRQVDAVRGSLAAAAHPDVAIFAALCFIDSTVGLFASPFVLDRVHVTWPKMLYKLVRSEGSLTAPQIADVERLLATALPPA
jgi:hypothetical protein